MLNTGAPGETVSLCHHGHVGPHLADAEAPADGAVTACQTPL